MKIDFNEVYKDRLREIDKQIKIAIYRKHWGIKSYLEIEKKELQKTLNVVEG